ncbi:MAG: TRAFs-binding domain-containing protein [Pseudomonadota bacterium]
MMDPLRAYEAAAAELDGGSALLETRVQAVRALARGGATDLALRRFVELGLEQETGDEDALALHGRLLKDRAATLWGGEKKDKLKESASAYKRAYELTGGTYSGINAATLLLLSGDEVAGIALAREIGDIIDASDTPDDARDRYFLRATRAEVLLLCGHNADASDALGDAISLYPDGLEERASTLRQFRRILQYRDEPLDWLDPHRPSAICFFAGRMPDRGNGVVDRRETIDRFCAVIEERGIGVGFGALAAGGDILFAEALIASGCELQIVLPSSEESFRAYSVDPFGEDWQGRFARCLEAAAGITITTNDQSLTGDVAIEYAAQLAMGAAIRTANERMSHVYHIVFAPRGGGLTERLRDVWMSSGRQTESITIDVDGEHRAPPPSPVPAKDERFLAAMLFADLFRFSELSHSQVSLAVTHVLSELGEALRAADGPPTYVNSWGDGIFAVFEGVEAAADAALAMQARMRAIDFSALGLPETLSLRVGAHYGPVSYLDDPITGRQSVYGSQVSQAAKIEPRAVPGSVLVSEAFAAMLALSNNQTFKTSYLGKFNLDAVDSKVRLFALTSVGSGQGQVR